MRPPLSQVPVGGTGMGEASSWFNPADGDAAYNAHTIKGRQIFRWMSLLLMRLLIFPSRARRGSTSRVQGNPVLPILFRLAGVCPPFHTERGSLELYLVRMHTYYMYTTEQQYAARLRVMAQA